MSTVFISYNREYESIVRLLEKDIEALGHSVWFDQELSGGQSWWDKILETIRHCDIFVLALSPEALDSIACNREYDYAARLGKPILPVLVADGISSNLLPPALSQIQFVDYRQQNRETALKLGRALTTIQPASPLPDPLPAPPAVPLSYLGSITERIEAENLSYEEQSTILLDLKRGLRTPETADDSRVLLEKLRKRRDILYSIAEEVDALMTTVEQEAAPHGEDHLEPPPVTPPNSKSIWMYLVPAAGVGAAVAAFFFLSQQPDPKLQGNDRGSNTGVVTTGEKPPYPPKDPQPEPHDQPPTVSNSHYYRVNLADKNSHLNIRSRANTNGKVIGELKNGSLIKVTGRVSSRTREGGKSGYWVAVNYRGRTGYAFDAFLTPISEKRVVTASVLFVRSRPDVTSAIIDKLKKGQSVEVLKKMSGVQSIGGRNGRWVEIRAANGRNGFVFDAHLKK